MIFQCSFSQDIKNVNDEVQEVVDVKNGVTKDVNAENGANNKTQEATGENNDSKLAKDINQTSDEVKAVNDGIQGTYEDTQKTIEIVGAVFGFGKKVSIEILSAHYDNEDVDMMFSQLVNIDGVRRPKREFKENNVVIEVKYQRGADLLWRSIPKETKDKFEPAVINDDKIIIKLKED